MCELMISLRGFLFSAENDRDGQSVPVAAPMDTNENEACWKFSQCYGCRYFFLFLSSVSYDFEFMFNFSIKSNFSLPMLT